MSDRRMNREDRRLCILQGVRKLFCKKGLSATSRELSEAAGVSEALIYKHFDSKEELYEALLEKSCQAHIAVGQELAEQPPSTFILICSTYLMVEAVTGGIETKDEEFSLTSDEVGGLLLQSLQHDGEVARRLFTQGLGPWVPYFVASMEAAKKSGDLVGGSIDFETLVWITHHAIMGVKMTLHPKPNAYMIEKVDFEETKNQIFIFVLRGMGLKNQVIEDNLKSPEFKEFKNKLLENQGVSP